MEKLWRQDEIEVRVFASLILPQVLQKPKRLTDLTCGSIQINKLLSLVRREPLNTRHLR